MEMEKFGLLGGKLGHSLSPQIHKLFFQYTGIEGSYELLETELEQLPGRMETLRKEFKGSNVTIPHKLHVIPLLDGIAPEAKAIGAVNTIKFTEKGAFGYNTDYFGFTRMLEYNDVALTNKIAAVLGSGGAARAIMKALADGKCKEIYLVTRKPSEVDPHFLDIAPQCKVIDYQELKNLKGDVLVNCTPVGMYPNIEASAVSQKVSANFEASVDLVYNPAKTFFLQQAELAGKKAVNGLFMLVAQAVAAQEIWQEQKYSSELIVKIIQELEGML